MTKRIVIPWRDCWEWGLDFPVRPRLQREVLTPKEWRRQ